MNAVVFAPGDMVRARGREWIVLPSPGEGMLNVRPLSGSDDDAQIIIPELESSPIEPASFAAPPLTGSIRRMVRNFWPTRCGCHSGVAQAHFAAPPIWVSNRAPISSSH
jgi:hypothetical protein